MLPGFWNSRIQKPRTAMAVLLPALIFSLASCNRVQRVSEEKQKTATEHSAQQTFQSPEEAGNAFVEAARIGDQNALLAIFGPGGAEVLLTGDAAKDKDNLQDLVAAYKQMHRWGNIKARGKVLQVGADNYVFPIPLGQNDSGRWYFDTAAGKDEVLARRIGRDERAAIAACQAIADAEHRYFERVRKGGDAKQFAQKFGSEPGRQNGLYWVVSEGQPASPLGSFGDFTKAMVSTDDVKQFNGYYYRILTRQGELAKGGAKDYVVNGKMTRGFAILAYPVEYKNSGLMSFVIGPDGVVYQKDLGEQTGNLAAAMADYNPGDGWSPVTQPSAQRG
jgi:hypothetical protein